MDSRLLADRHPALGRLYRVWLARGEGAAMPLAGNITERLADLDDVIVVIRRPAASDETLRIERSGKDVDRLYGVALAGEPVGRLTPSSADADNEAAIVLASGCTLMMEDQAQLSGGSVRVVRLYLPFADEAGAVAGVVVGIVKAA
ncbi:PAS domain-containing protein [Xanthobacter autotrophicus]|uniref:hypothetical protein n=1 Tax=Xanthobacter autotrophicus TaxID=280 RepID=UPI0037273CC0